MVSRMKISSGQKTPQDALDAWPSSPGHRKIIENSSYTHTGLGFKEGSGGRIYWTQIFLKI